MCWNCYDEHEPDECQFLQQSNLQKNYLIEHFDLITPLRLLLLLRRLHALAIDGERYGGGDGAGDEVTSASRRTYRDLIGMESHFEQRQNTLIWHQHRRAIIDPLRQSGLYECFMFDGQYINDDFVQKICGILDVNSFDVRTQTSQVFLTNRSIQEE